MLNWISIVYVGCVKSHSELVSESQKFKYVTKKDAEMHFDKLSVKIQHDVFEFSHSLYVA